MNKYELAAARKNYRARLRRKIDKVKWLSASLDWYQGVLRLAMRDVALNPDKFSCGNIERMCNQCYKMSQRMAKLHSELSDSCAKRTLGFTMDDIFIDGDYTQPFTFEYECEHMNHIDGEDEAQRFDRAKQCAINFLYSFISNCNCLSSCTEYSDVDDEYEENIRRMFN